MPMQQFISHLHHEVQKVTSSDKLGIVCELDAEGAHATIAERHKVSRSLVARLNSIASISKFMVTTCGGTSNMSSAAQRIPKYAIIERELFDWFAECRIERKMISGRILMKALKTRNYITHDEQTIEYLHGVSAFKASAKWYFWLEETYSIGLRCAMGTDNILLVETIIAGHAMIKQEAEAFGDKDIFNVDESGLFYR